MKIEFDWRLISLSVLILVAVSYLVFQVAETLVEYSPTAEIPAGSDPVYRAPDEPVGAIDGMRTGDES